MHNGARYQIFISSTFRDLKEERKAVQDAVHSLGHFPIGMELFPASSLSAWKVIERVIKESDYYVLIIGGRYGSVDDDGLSFTEKEYDFAVANGKPIVPLLHRDPDELPRKKTEKDPAAASKLEAFRERVEKAHHCNYWTSPSDLKSYVLASLVSEFNTSPMPGWVRDDGVSKRELLQRLTELQGRYDQVTQERDAIRLQLSRVDDSDQQEAALSNTIELEVVANGQRSKVQLSLADIFIAIGPVIAGGGIEGSVRTAINGLCKEWLSRASGKPVDAAKLVSHDQVKPIAINLIASDLIRIDQVSGPNGAIYTGWHLTRRGATLYQKISSAESES